MKTVGGPERDMWQAMFEHQLEMQKESFGIDPRTLEGDERKQFVCAMSIALVSELGEMLNEIPWKPWSTKTNFDEQAFLGELIDALHFWFNLALIATDDPQLLCAMYFAKADVNARRQAEGYDESNKDANGRALDEPHLVMEPPAWSEMNEE